MTFRQAINRAKRLSRETGSATILDEGGRAIREYRQGELYSTHTANETRAGAHRRGEVIDTFEVHSAAGRRPPIFTHGECMEIWNALQQYCDNAVELDDGTTNAPLAAETALEKLNIYVEAACPPCPGCGGAPEGGYDGFCETCWTERALSAPRA